MAWEWGSPVVTGLNCPTLSRLRGRRFLLRAMAYEPPQGCLVTTKPTPRAGRYKEADVTPVNVVGEIHWYNLCVPVRMRGVCYQHPLIRLGMHVLLLVEYWVWRVQAVAPVVMVETTPTDTQGLPKSSREGRVGGAGMGDRG